MEDILTAEAYDKLAFGIFREGFITIDGELKLEFKAIKEYHSWKITIIPNPRSIRFLEKSAQELGMQKVIETLVPCTQEVLSLYKD